MYERRNVCQEKDRGSVLQPQPRALHSFVACLCLSQCVKLAEGVACPARVQMVPTSTLGILHSWLDTDHVPRLDSNKSSSFSSDCCPSGQASEWTVTPTDEYSWVGEVAATCTDGTKLQPVTFGRNGSTNCTRKLAENSTIVPAIGGSLTARSQILIYQLFGVGFPIEGTLLDYDGDLKCPNGTNPIGFGARSSCYSIIGFKVICAPPYDTNPTLNSSINSCNSTKDRQAVPSIPLGTTSFWIRAANSSLTRQKPYSPAVSIAAGPPQSDCCNTGQIISWTIAATQDAYLGSISATCSDGNILRGVQAGLNHTGQDLDIDLDCDLRLFSETTVIEPSEFNYSAGNVIYSFLAPLQGFGDVQPVMPNQSFSCPGNTVPTGLSVSSACLSLAGLQIYCSVPAVPYHNNNKTASPARAPAPAPKGLLSSSGTGEQSKNGSGGLSAGAIAGIVIGTTVGLAAMALLVGIAWKKLKAKDTQDVESTSNGDRNQLRSTPEQLSAEQSVPSVPLTTAIPFSDFVEGEASIGDAVDINDVTVSSSNSSSFDGLPADWHIPLRRVKLICVDSRPVELGKGGFGVVYQAIVRQEPAAIKIVDGGHATAQARLLHEITVLEKCKSMHTVHFLGYSVAGSRLLLCMELMEGGSLYQALRRDDEFQWYNRGREAMVAVTAGLSWLHEQGVAHLDMKTPNLLITSDRKVKIADFGLGKLVNGPTANTATQMGSFIWMAPELILRGTFGLASDLFSLSTIFWEVCTLQKPSRAIVVEEMVAGRDAPEEMIKLIAACRKDDPRERPTIDQVCEWLGRIP